METYKILANLAVLHRTIGIDKDYAKMVKDKIDDILKSAPVGLELNLDKSGSKRLFLTFTEHTVKIVPDMIVDFELQIYGDNDAELSLDLYDWLKKEGSYKELIKE